MFTKDDFDQAFNNIVEEVYMEKVARISTESRERMKPQSFAIPEKKAYPISDIAHARNALARVSQFGTPEERARVRRAVYEKYPSLKEHFKERTGETPTSKEIVKKPRLGQVTGKPSEAQSPRYLKAHAKAIRTPVEKKAELGKEGTEKQRASFAARHPVLAMAPGMSLARLLAAERLKGIVAAERGKKGLEEAPFSIRHPYLASLIPIYGRFAMPLQARETAKELGLKMAALLKKAQDEESYEEGEGEEGMPTPGFAVQHPVLSTLMGGIGGGAGLGALGYGIGSAVGAPQIGAGVGATLGSLLGAALGAKAAEDEEEQYSQELLDYLTKGGSLDKQADK